MTCIIFPGLLVFRLVSPDGSDYAQREVCFHKKKDRIWLPYPSTFPNTPRFLWGQGYVVALLKRDVAPSPLRQDLRGAESGVYSTQLTETSGATALGRRADCKVRRVAESQTLTVSWLRRLCTLSLCLSLRASISNCPWGTIITLLSPSVAPLLPALLLCSFSSAFNHQPIKSRVFSSTVQSGLGIFSFFTNTTSWKLDALD